MTLDQLDQPQTCCYCDQLDRRITELESLVTDEIRELRRALVLLHQSLDRRS